MTSNSSVEVSSSGGSDVDAILMIPALHHNSNSKNNRPVSMTPPSRNTSFSGVAVNKPTKRRPLWKRILKNKKGGAKNSKDIPLPVEKQPTINHSVTDHRLVSSQINPVQEKQPAVAIDSTDNDAPASASATVRSHSHPNSRSSSYGEGSLQVETGQNISRRISSNGGASAQLDFPEVASRNSGELTATATNCKNDTISVSEVPPTPLSTSEINLDSSINTRPVVEPLKLPSSNNQLYPSKSPTGNGGYYLSGGGKSVASSSYCKGGGIGYSGSMSVHTREQMTLVTSTTASMTLSTSRSQDVVSQTQMKSNGGALGSNTESSNSLHAIAASSGGASPATSMAESDDPFDYGAMDANQGTVASGSKTSNCTIDGKQCHENSSLLDDYEQQEQIVQDSLEVRTATNINQPVAETTTSAFTAAAAPKSNPQNSPKGSSFSNNSTVVGGTVAERRRTRHRVTVTRQQQQIKLAGKGTGKAPGKGVGGMPKALGRKKKAISAGIAKAVNGENVDADISGISHKNEVEHSNINKSNSTSLSSPTNEALVGGAPRNNNKLVKGSVEMSAAAVAAASAIQESNKKKISPKSNDGINNLVLPKHNHRFSTPIVDNYTETANDLPVTMTGGNDDDHPHLYAEINIPAAAAKKIQCQRQISAMTTETNAMQEGDDDNVSLALTSVSSLTGRSWMFGTTNPATVEGLAGGIGGMGNYTSLIPKVMCGNGREQLERVDMDNNHGRLSQPYPYQEENYFDYDEDIGDELENHHKMDGNCFMGRDVGITNSENERESDDGGFITKLTDAWNEACKSACQCLDIESGELPWGRVREENNVHHQKDVAHGSLGDTEVNNTKGGTNESSNRTAPSLPTFSDPML
mmetsp:Transcript_4485/g.9937  ORF Transcript_4485/g.9937 Transcript_4485/m.9937 type:complete len:867 (+) Transcript_4485:111-2711(+)